MDNIDGIILASGIIACLILILILHLRITALEIRAAAQDREKVFQQKLDDLLKSMVKNDETNPGA